MIKKVKFADYQDEITSMMYSMQYLEHVTGDIPIDEYIDYDNKGVVHPLLWTDGDTIKGLIILFVSNSMRNPSVLDAQTDVIWVKPKYRGNSDEFVQGIRDYLKTIDVNHWYAASRISHPIDGFLERNHFKPLEKLYYCEV